MCLYFFRSWHNLAKTSIPFRFVSISISYEVMVSKGVIIDCTPFNYVFAT